MFFSLYHQLPAAMGGKVRDLFRMYTVSVVHITCTVKCRVNAHGRLLDFDPKMGGGGGGCLLGAGNFWCIVIAHGRILRNSSYMHAYWVPCIIMCTATKS